MKKIFNLLINVLDFIFSHMAELFLLLVFVFSFFPFFTTAHGHNYYTFCGAVFTFLSMMFIGVGFINGTEPLSKASKPYTALLSIILILSMVSIYFIKDKFETSKYTDFELCMTTYFGGLMGAMFGGFVSGFIDGERREKENKLKNKLKIPIKQEVKNDSKIITIYLNHYEDDKYIYKPIIDKLLSEGWEIDKQKTKTESIGISQFNHVYLNRKF